MQKNTNELKSIIEQRIKEGKQPTIALIKSRLTVKHSVPEMIIAIKSFMRTPNTANITNTKVTPSTSLSAEQRIAQLKQPIVQ